MMENSRNIEDLFNRSFNDYQESPSSGVWQSLNKKLGYHRFMNAVKNVFSGFTVEPGTGVWMNISRKIWWYNFLRFSLQRFNIYYLFLFLSMLAGTAWYVAGIEKNNTLAPRFASGQGVDKEMLMGLLLPEKQASTESSGQNLEDRNAPGVRHIQNGSTTRSLNNSPLRKSHAENTNFRNISFDIPDLDIPGTSSVKDLADSEEQHADITAVLDKTEEKTENKLEIEKAVPPDPLQPLSPELPKDTIGVNAAGQFIVSRNSQWSIQFYAEGFRNKTELAIFDNEFPEELNYTQYNSAPAWSYSIGADINYAYKNWLFKTGAAFSSINHNMEAERIKINHFTITDIENTGFWDYDTTEFINIDSLYGGEGPVIIKIIDSTWVSDYDTTYFPRYDTLRNTNKFTSQYKYFEIPLMVGYKWNRNRFTWFAATGVSAGFLVRAGGYTISPDSRIMKANDDLPYTKPVFSFICSPGVTYNLTRRWGITATAQYRKNIQSIFKPDYPVNQKSSSLRWRMGVTYKF